MGRKFTNGFSLLSLQKKKKFNSCLVAYNDCLVVSKGLSLFPIIKHMCISHMKCGNNVISGEHKQTMGNKTD